MSYLDKTFTTSLFLTVLFMCGCMTKDVWSAKSNKSDVGIGGMKRIVWRLTMKGMDGYEFSHELICQTVVFSQRGTLYEYLENSDANGEGVLVLSKAFQVLSNDEMRTQVNDVARQLEKCKFHVIGVQLETSTRSYPRIYRFHELPFLQGVLPEERP